jgi:hypothetical protein
VVAGEAGGDQGPMAGRRLALDAEERRGRAADEADQFAEVGAVEDLLGVALDVDLESTVRDRLPSSFAASASYWASRIEVVGASSGTCW